MPNQPGTKGMAVKEHKGHIEEKACRGNTECIHLCVLCVLSRLLPNPEQ
jgi:hypothetical protein